MRLNRSYFAPFFAIALAACAAPSSSADDAVEGPEDVQEAAAQLSSADLVPQLHGVLVPQSNQILRDAYQLGARDWLKWAMALPWSTGPINDTTGASCGQGQSGPVWFLAGTAGGPATRSCTIPKNKLLFFPLIDNWVIATADQVANPADFADYKAFVADYLPSLRPQTCELHLTLDGVAIAGSTRDQIDQKLWVQITDPFGVTLNNDNFASQYGIPGGFTPAATVAGHWALITPLTKGAHVLEFGGSMCDENNAVQFTTSAVYNLTVQ